MISKNAKFWIWLTQTLGYNTPKVKRLCELYPDISQFCLSDKREWKFCGILSDADISKLSSTSFDISQQIIDRCDELGYEILCIDDPKYPKCLYNIDTPPAVIYISGNLPDVDNRLTIGIVGTRRATKYGLDNSYKIGYALSKYGVATVSGGALGIDCASHRGSLAADGVTVCVRGCGINCSYLKENAGMRKAITKRGAVISEYPPDEFPRNYYFPARNRIISALSDGVVIIESGVKSGSLITACLALEKGKEVFERMYKKIDDIVKEIIEEAAKDSDIQSSKDKQIVIVSHGGAIRCYLAGLLSMPFGKRFAIAKTMENTSITQVNYNLAHDNYTVEMINDYSHLAGHEELLREYFKPAF